MATTTPVQFNLKNLEAAKRRLEETTKALEAFETELRSVEKPSKHLLELWALTRERRTNAQKRVTETEHALRLAEREEARQRRLREAPDMEDALRLAGVDPRRARAAAWA